MIDPQVIVKANYNRTLVTVRVSAINSSDWTHIVATEIELFRDAGMTNRFYRNSTTHYKVRAYLENEPPNETVYARVVLTKDDDTTHTYTFNFVVPYPVLGTIKDDNGTQYITSMRKMDTAGNLSPRNYTNKAVSIENTHIDIKADAAGDMVVGDPWSGSIWVKNLTQDTEPVRIGGDGMSITTTVAVNDGDIVRVTEYTPNSTFRRWRIGATACLCKGVSAHIIYMPSMDKFTLDEAGTIAGTNFFASFNASGTITSFPEGSFDTHKITTIGSSQYSQSNSSFFSGFNSSGALTALPEGSFDITNILIFGNSSFRNFNYGGALTSLPAGSFDTSNATACTELFYGFNQNGALASLPDGSFGMDSATTVKGAFCHSFARNSQLTSLPAGSFHFKEGSEIGSGAGSMFQSFNHSGLLTSLPEHSFNFYIKTERYTQAIFQYFNSGGALTSLPAGSFRFSPSNTVIDGTSFQYFNSYGALTSLPAGSFKTDGITSIYGYRPFGFFNSYGALTALPEDSFNFDSLTYVHDQYPFISFNQGGALKSLPKGSFSFKNLTTFRITTYSYFCDSFNYQGALEYLPIGSFSVSGVTPATEYAFTNFNHAGKLPESETDYNPDFVNIGNSNSTAHYYNNGSSQVIKTISSRSPYKWYQADYYEVFYTPDATFTTDIHNTYLSGKLCTFTATAVDPVYSVSPTITTAGGVPVAVTDNGDDTFTFTMPQDSITVTFAVQLKPAHITLVAEEAGQMNVKNVWNTPVVVQNVTQEAEPVTLNTGEKAFVTVAVDDEVTVTESSTNVTFRGWNTNSEYFAVGVLCHITKMPPIQRFTTSATSETLGDSSFSFFCAAENGKGITSLPAGSFDTSVVTKVNGDDIFREFNYQGLLTSLPAGSFDLSNITELTGDQFLFAFNALGKLSRDTTDYNANFINASSADILADYWQGGSQYEKRTIPPGEIFYYGTA